MPDLCGALVPLVLPILLFGLGDFIHFDTRRYPKWKKRVLTFLANNGGKESSYKIKIHLGQYQRGWSDGSPTLRRMEREGLLTFSQGAHTVPVRGNRPRTYYSLTEQGREEAKHLSR